MGGIGSGGGNRKSAEHHKRVGNFRPSVHGNRLGEVVELPLPRAPQFPAPATLGTRGKEAWTHVWLHVTGLGERERTLVQHYCECEDQVGQLYQAMLEALQADKAPANRGRTRQTPALARALAGAQKERRAALAMLGMSPKDRQAFGPGNVQRPRDALVALRRKAPG